MELALGRNPIQISFHFEIRAPRSGARESRARAPTRSHPLQFIKVSYSGLEAPRAGRFYRRPKWLVACELGRHKPGRQCEAARSAHSNSITQHGDTTTKGRVTLGLVFWAMFFSPRSTHNQMPASTFLVHLSWALERND